MKLVIEDDEGSRREVALDRDEIEASGSFAVIDITQEGPRVVDMVEGLSFEELQRVTAVPLLAPAATPINI